MVHLLPLPGSPGFGGSFAEVVADASSRARTLADAGFPALMVENFGDIPFYADRVPAVTVAAMTRCVEAVIDATGLPVGVNVLRNDVESALAIAAVTGARFVRVNVLAGTMYTDQGPIVGRAADVLRQRAALCPEVAIWADVLVNTRPASGTDPRPGSRRHVGESRSRRPDRLGERNRPRPRPRSVP